MIVSLKNSKLASRILRPTNRFFSERVVGFEIGERCIAVAPCRTGAIEKQKIFKVVIPALTQG